MKIHPLLRSLKPRITNCPQTWSRGLKGLFMSCSFGVNPNGRWHFAAQKACKICAGTLNLAIDPFFRRSARPAWRLHLRKVNISLFRGQIGYSCFNFWVALLWNQQLIDVFLTKFVVKYKMKLAKNCGAVSSSSKFLATPDHAAAASTDIQISSLLAYNPSAFALDLCYLPTNFVCQKTLLVTECGADASYGKSPGSSHPCRMTTQPSRHLLSKK